MRLAFAAAAGFVVSVSAAVAQAPPPAPVAKPTPAKTTSDTTVPPTILTPTPLPPSQPPPLPPPVPVPLPPVAHPTDAEVSRWLVGVWWTETDEMTITNALNPDGSYSSTREYKRGFRRLFEPRVRSSGTWSLKDGILLGRLTTSTDSHLINQVFSLRVVSVNATELVTVNDEGKAVRFVRIR